jgi:capsid protein
MPVPAPVRGRYDAAATTDENRRHWANADLLSATAANNPQVRRTLRARARYEVANNSYARGIVLTLANAQATRLGNHTTTLAYEFARQGRDWESELRQRAKEVALVRQLGLSEPQAPEPEESEPTDTQDTEQEEDDNATAHP